MDFYASNNMEGVYCLSELDHAILNSYAELIPALKALLGDCCLAVLRSASDETFPCIAIENGWINNTSLGDPAPNFIIDAIADENRAGQKSIIGPYITKTENEHSIKSVVYIIRNPGKRVIGCLCIGVDISMPLNTFLESFMLKVDEGLANSISELGNSSIPEIDALVRKSMANAQKKANSVSGISATDRNRMVVHQLRDENIFSVRGAVNIVANELGVSRYTIYNYLKDVSGN